MLHQNEKKQENLGKKTFKILNKVFPRSTINPQKKFWDKYIS